ncbi:hypothetical protein [Hydrocoleum sp. CS-953]|uniref:hypothetical protein n=1 Tax=Hydrocoleum sp. CS-953 TaxID=1671698 RepID=UPI000B9AEA9E|nr:hypothetical protein [Hydrocoleum sp. CS-953]
MAIFGCRRHGKRSIPYTKKRSSSDRRLTDTIYRRKTQTLYVKWGDWLTPVLVVGSVLTKIILDGFRE